MREHGLCQGLEGRPQQVPMAVTTVPGETVREQRPDTPQRMTKLDDLRWFLFSE